MSNEPTDPRGESEVDEEVIAAAVMALRARAVAAGRRAGPSRPQEPTHLPAWMLAVLPAPDPSATAARPWAPPPPGPPR